MEVKQIKKVIVIGLGLIGGSLALELKKRLGCTVWGIDTNADNIQKALELGFIEQQTSYEVLCEKDIDLVIVSVPVNYIPQVVAEVLDKVSDNALVMDMGSVKSPICQSVATHPRRKQFVAAHPMAGTEFSGPQAAIYNLFDTKVMALCEVEKSDWQLLDRALSFAKILNMRVKMLPAEEHDRHTAYISHLSHVSSFMLGKTVLEIEKDEESIFDLASTGFASTVRLAKSDADMWSPIFLENKANVLKSLDEYIKNLIAFRELIQNDDDKAIRATIHEINYIKKVLDR